MGRFRKSRRRIRKGGGPNDRFPESFKMAGLKPGYKSSEWEAVMSVPRSDAIRELAREEWEAEQAEEYDDKPNWRWELSYLSGKGIGSGGKKSRRKTKRSGGRKRKSRAKRRRTRR